MSMSNSKRVRDEINKMAGYKEVRPGKWLPDGLFCVRCGKYSKPEDANNLNCRCGGKLIEVKP